MLPVEPLPVEPLPVDPLLVPADGAVLFAAEGGCFACPAGAPDGRLPDGAVPEGALAPEPPPCGPPDGAEPEGADPEGFDPEGFDSDGFDPEDAPSEDALLDDPLLDDPLPLDVDPRDCWVPVLTGAQVVPATLTDDSVVAPADCADSDAFTDGAAPSLVPHPARTASMSTLLAPTKAADRPNGVVPMLTLSPPGPWRACAHPEWFLCSPATAPATISGGTAGIPHRPPEPSQARRQFPAASSGRRGARTPDLPGVNRML